jgi:hypothetical protein
MATVIEDILPKSSVVLCVFFCGQKDSMQRIFIKKCFMFTVKSVCRIKRFEKFCQGCSKSRTWCATRCGSGLNKRLLCCAFQRPGKATLVEDMSRNDVFFSRCYTICDLFTVSPFYIQLKNIRSQTRHHNFTSHQINSVEFAEQPKVEYRYMTVYNGVCSKSRHFVHWEILSRDKTS